MTDTYDMVALSQQDIEQVSGGSAIIPPGAVPVPGHPGFYYVGGNHLIPILILGAGGAE